MKPVSGKRFAKALEQNGWALARVRGSHHTFVKSGEIPVTVPIHGSSDLKIGLQLALMRASGVTEGNLK